MSKFQSFMEEKFIPVSTKIANNKYLKSLSVGSMNLMTIIIVGAMFSLLSSIGFKPYQDFITNTGIKNILDFVPNATTNLMAVLMVISVAYVASKNFGHGELSFNVSILALASFIILMPLNVIKFEGAFMPSTLIDYQYLGARAIFLALITALVVSRIYCFLVDRNWTIKMPEGTPEQVIKAFISLIPSFVIILLFALIRYGFSITHFESANNFIYSVLQIPLQNLTGSLPAFIIIVLVAQMLWFFGIHGSYTVLPIFIPIWIGYIADNSAAFAAGKAIPNIYNAGLYNFTTIGGCGSTLGFVIVMTLFSRSQRYKTYSKMFLPAGIFNINEPVVFGVPLILNPITLIPFIITPLVTLIAGVALIKFNIMPAPIGIMIPSSTPPILSGLLQGSWKISVFEVCAILFSCLTYYPFFKVLDKQALDEENKEKEILDEAVKA